LDGEVARELDGAEARIGESDWPEAEEAVQRVEKLLAAAGRSEPPRLRELQRDVAMARRLEDIYSQPSTHEVFTGKEQEPAYAQAFRAYGIDLTVFPVGGTVSAPPGGPRTIRLLPVGGQRRVAIKVAGPIRARSIRLELARGLDMWSFMRRRAGSRGAPD